MKYVWKFLKLCFRNKDKSRSSKIWQRLSHPNRPFKTTLCTFSDHWCFVTASAWADGTAVISISSRVSLDMNALFAPSSSKLKRRISSSWVKCLEHIEEFRVGSLRSPLFYEINPLLSPDISLFPGFRRREKELPVKLNPCAHLGRQNILQQHVYPAYFACYSKKLLSVSEVRYRVDVTSLLVPSLSIAPFWIQYGGKFASNCRFRPPFKRRRNAE